jgi:hypothetical protein
MATNNNENMQEICFKYLCEKCEYYTNKKSSFNNHLLSNKHNNPTSIIIFKNNNTCENCKKQYKSREGLWRHKKKCINSKEEMNENKKDSDNELIIMLVKQNKELQDIVIEQSKQIIELSKNKQNSEVIIY